MDFFSDLSGKRVVVTGACGVVGRWIVDAFVAAGAELCLTDAQEAALSAYAGEVSLGTGGFAHPANLTDERSIEGLITEIGRRWGAADVLGHGSRLHQ